VGWRQAVQCCCNTHGDGQSPIDRVIDSAVVVVRKARADDITTVDEISEQS